MKRLTDDQIQDAFEYMTRHWVDGCEGWSDFAAIANACDAELLAYYLVDAGAIDSTECFKEAQDVEKVIEKLALRIEKLSDKQRHQRIVDTFKDCFIADCKTCGCVSFFTDGNEELYPDVKTECWECGSKDIETKRGLK